MFLRYWFAAILIVAAFTQSAQAQSRYLGFTWDRLNEFLTCRNEGTLPSANDLQGLMRSYENASAIRKHDRQLYIEGNIRWFAQYESRQLPYLQSASPNGEAYRLLSDFLLVAKKGYENNLRLAKEFSDGVSFFDELKERFAAMESLPNQSKCAYWNGEEKLRQKILSEAKAFLNKGWYIDYYSEYSSMGTTPSLTSLFKLKDFRFFSSIASYLPPLLLNPIAGTLGGSGVIYFGKFEFDPKTCTDKYSGVRREITSLFTIELSPYEEEFRYFGNSSVPMIPILDRLLPRAALKVNCKRVSKKSAKTIVDLSTGVVDLRFHYDSGSCGDPYGCVPYTVRSPSFIN